MQDVQNSCWELSGKENNKEGRFMFAVVQEVKLQLLTRAESFFHNTFMLSKLYQVLFVHQTQQAECLILTWRQERICFVSVGMRCWEPWKERWYWISWDENTLAQWHKTKTQDAQEKYDNWGNKAHPTTRTHTHTNTHTASKHKLRAEQHIARRFERFLFQSQSPP